MKEHHFIVKYTSENGWTIDTDSELARFPDGTIWNNDTAEWNSAYLGNEQYDNEDESLMEALSVKLAEMNSN